MCGFAHSTFVTTPLSVTGLLMSNSAAKEWCADRVRASTSTTAAQVTKRFVFIFAPDRQLAIRTRTVVHRCCCRRKRFAVLGNSRAAEPAAACLLGIDRQLLEQGIVAENRSGADDDGRQRIFDDLDGELRLLLNAAIEIAQ